MRLPLMLAAGAVGLWPIFAQATDAANFTLKTTQDLYVVCSTPNNDPLRAQAINFCEGYPRSE